MSGHDDIASARRSRRRDEVQLQRYWLGSGIAIGFFVGLAGYAVTGRGAWFLAVPVGIMLGWRLASGRWRLWRNIGED